MLLAILLLAALSTSPVRTALPQFSWDTLPVFFHSANTSGQFNQDALKTIAKYQMATIEKRMGFDTPGTDDEDEMVLAMKALKEVNPNIATYFYMNSWIDVTFMTRMSRELNEHPDYFLRDSEGTKVKNNRGEYAIDVSKPEVRQWWKNICLNATKSANGDGCFCDASNKENSTFTPSPPETKLKAWAEGLLNLTREVQDALGDDKLLIGKEANQSYVKAVMIEYFYANNDSINSLMLGMKVGQIVEAHVPIKIDCSGDLTDYIAAFLIGAEKYAYFGCGHWFIVGENTESLTWRPEYDKPLGEPRGPAVYSSDDGVWTRSFASGTQVRFDANKNKGTIKWAE